MSQDIIDEEGQRLRHIVAGMLSTIEFTPAAMHPGNMLPMADNVIHHIRLLTSEDRSAETYPVQEREAFPR